MDEGTGLIPEALVTGAATSDTEAAEQIAQRLLPAVQGLAGDEPAADTTVSVRRISTAADVSSFRIDITNSPYYATITEHNVIERYHVERPRTASGRRIEMRPVLIEVMHIFTVHDAEGALVSATEALRAPGATPNELEPNVFSELFEAARGAKATEPVRVSETA